MSFIRPWSAVLLLMVAAGCHHAPPVVARQDQTPTPPAAQAAPPPLAPRPRAVAPAAASPVTEAERFQRMSLDALNASHPLDDVFFDYDQQTLRADARRSLQADAQWLEKWPTTIVRVDGSSDERGSAEYNLALGDRRAVAAREYLTSLGVVSDRIQVRSLGKDAPFCHESNESCWLLNRRGHMVITSK